LPHWHALVVQTDGAYSRQDYLAAAERGFAHLQQHNLSYLDDGKENIIDDYCALLAATELYAASQKPDYAIAAELRAKKLLQRQTEEGWFWANDEQSRSYFHAAEAGLPYIALLRFCEVLATSGIVPECMAGLKRALQHELNITNAGNPIASSDGIGNDNHFGYPRQYIVRPGHAARSQFFIPHENESGYWWQGENARLASLASAALWASQVLNEAALADDLEKYALSIFNWIFGLNPFDVCMMQGIGQNNPQYAKGFWNAPGGVCNGITSGQENENDIDFRLPEQSEPMHSWRWSEQWIPHGAWLLHALSQQLFLSEQGQNLAQESQ